MASKMLNLKHWDALIEISPHCYLETSATRVTKKNLLEMKKAPELTLCKRLLGSALRFGNDRNKRLVGASFLEDYGAVRKSEQGVVFSHSHVATRVVLGPPLTHDNITGYHLLTSKYLYTESFAFRLTAVLYFTFPFLVCHGVE